jgi:ribosomal-protein-alanine N-acetyltransferase
VFGFAAALRMAFPFLSEVASQRLTLRPVAASDLADLLEVNGDPEVTEFLPYATWQSLADGAAWLTRMEVLAAAGTGQQLVLVRNADGKVLGTLLLFRYEEGSRRVELGYALGRRYWNNGFMREAIQSACSHLFASHAVRRIEAEVNPANVPSNKLLLRLGFVLEGTLRKRWIAKDIAYDTHMYGCLADDWLRTEQAALSGGK